MQKEFTIKSSAAIHSLSTYQQAQIRGGSATCGCSDEKRRTIKIKKPPVTQALFVEPVDIADTPSVIIPIVVPTTL